MPNREDNGKTFELHQIGSSKLSNSMPQPSGIRSYQVVNEGTDEQYVLYGYSRSKVRTVITWIFILLTVGFLRLIFYWKPHWFLQCCCVRADLSTAQYVLLKDRYQQWYVETVLTIDNNQQSTSRNHIQTNSRTEYENDVERQRMDDKETFRYFINKRWRYVWQPAEYKFTKLLGVEHNVNCDYFRQIRPLTVEDRAKRKLIYGENSIALRLTPILKLLIREVLSPFYIFQLFSCTLWYADEYVTYASCIVFISVVSVILTLRELRKNERALRDTVHQSEVTTVVIYNPETNEEEKHDIISEDLVPGDVIIIRGSTTMQCDAVLLNGNVIVNEAMLTGESVPVTKVQVPYYHASSDHPALQLPFDIKDHNRFILFSGTSVIQTRYYDAGDVRGVVTRTAFSTAKGELVRSILYPKPVDFKFNKDTYKYVGGMAMIAFGGMIFSIILRIIRKEPVGVIIKRTIDVITIAVPPALPAALSAGLVYAQNRLKKNNIFCISPSSINICGSINTVVFDKTGTLTEDGLDLQCVVPVVRKYDIANSVQQLDFGEEISEVTGLNWRDDPAHSMIIVCMAACHTLTRINGELAGDPLDLKMLGFTQYELHEPVEDERSNYDILFPTIVRPIQNPNNIASNNGRIAGSVSSLIAGNVPFEIGIVRALPFSSSLQRTSVIVRILAKDSFDLLTKGSPEKIAELSRPETIPKNFNSILSTYAKQGYRVLALAYKPLDLNYVKIQRIEREKIEENLIFLGLVVMENRLKPQTEGVLKTLTRANIRSIMCTGDNMLTALSVARDCDMIPDDAKIIVVEATEPNTPPTFTYAQVFNRKVREVRYDLNSHSLIELDRRSPYHFAISGKSFQVVREEHPELLRRLCVRGTVFARMLPEQKQQLIETLQELGYYVSMCGDGANDVGALKAAHAGISLSTADASVASPFTSRTPTIECVPTIIREGRAALVTSFGVVKYMVAYSLTQFLTVIMLYTIGNNLTDYEFLFIDLGLITLLVLLFSRTESYPYLDPKPPRTKLISWRPLFSLLGQLGICAGFQAFIFEYVKFQPWYEPYEFNTDKIYVSYINTAIFLQSTFQYIWESIVFSRGAPYRRSIFSNWLFLFAIVLSFGFSIILLFLPIKSMYNFFELRIIPDLKFKFIILTLAILNFVLMFLFEEYVIENDYISFKRAPLSSTSRNKNARAGTHHLHIENLLRLTPDWPPILATPSEEDKMTQHVLVNETKRNDQPATTTPPPTTTDEYF